jgi:hypothetical protein
VFLPISEAVRPWQSSARLWALAFARAGLRLHRLVQEEGLGLLTDFKKQPERGWWTGQLQLPCSPRRPTPGQPAVPPLPPPAIVLQKLPILAAAGS